MACLMAFISRSPNVSKTISHDFIPNPIFSLILMHKFINFQSKCTSSFILTCNKDKIFDSFDDLQFCVKLKCMYQFRKLLNKFVPHTSYNKLDIKRILVKKFVGIVWFKTKIKPVVMSYIFVIIAPFVSVLRNVLRIKR